MTIPEIFAETRPAKFLGEVPPGTHVKQNQIAVSTGELTTSGLLTCVALEVSSPEKVLFSHVDASADSGQLAYHIRNNFDSEAKVRVINSSVDDVVTVHARNKCLQALSFAGVTSPVEYVAWQEKWQ